MIPKQAVDQYVEQDRDSHVWMKKLSRRDLWTEVNALWPEAHLYEDLGLHQLVCFLLGVAYPQFAFWLDMGTGKTLITLELLNYFWNGGARLRRGVILITSDKAFPTWEKQIKRYGIKIPYVLLEGSSEEKWQILTEFGDGLIFISYPGLGALITDLVERKKGKKKGTRRWKVNNDLVDRFWEEVDAVVMDESTKAANHGSIAFDVIDKCPATIRYALAGRPFGRDPTLLWAQHYLVDGGETLGPTLGMFREAFFTSAPNKWVEKRRQKYIKKWTFDKRKEAKLARMIQHRSITYGAEECIDLPDYRPIIEDVAFSREAGSYYDRAVEEMIKSKGKMEATKNVFLRMRQLSSGFLGFKDDETGEKAQVEFDENPKFDRLMERLDEMPLDRKGVVFYEFTWSGRKIFEEAKKMGFKPIWLWSGTKDYKADLHRFETSPGCGLCVVNNKVGAFSLDGLQVANYAHIYESPVSPIDREQLERRLRRQGQTRTVFQYDYVVRESADQKILDFHAEGEALMTSLLRNPSILKRKKDG